MLIENNMKGEEIISEILTEENPNKFEIDEEGKKNEGL